MPLPGRSWTLGLALIALMPLAPASRGRTTSQDAQAVTHLQQEVSNLRFKLEYETGRLQRSVEDLERRLRLAESRPSAGAPLAPLPPRPAPEDTAEIAVQRLVLKDAAGRTRGVLTVSERLGPMLALVSVGGDIEALLSVPAAGPRLELFDAVGTERVRVALEAEDAEVRLFDRSGEVIARLGGPPEVPEQRPPR